MVIARNLWPGSWSPTKPLLVCLMVYLPALLLGAEPAQDQQAANSGNVEIPPLAVVATHAPREVAALPWMVITLSDDDWQLRLPSASLADALGKLPGILPQKTGIGMTSPYIRGFTAQRTVLVVDGVRLNNSFLRDGPNQYWSLVDPYFYQRLELLYGPASVQYGSDAVGGVVTVFSHPLERGPADRGWLWQGGELSSRYASADHSFGEHLRAQVSIADRWAFSLGLTRQEFGDLRTGGDLDNPGTSYDQWGLNLRARYWISADDSLYFGFDQTDQDKVNRTHATVAHQDFEGTLSKGGASDFRRLFDHDQRIAFARLERRNGHGWWQEMDLGVSYHEVLENYQRIRTDGRQSLRANHIETVALNLRLASASDLGRLTVGVDASHDRVRTAGVDFSAAGVPTFRLQGDVADDASYDLLGLYGQHELPLGESWELISGIRYDYAAMNADAVNFGGVKGTLAGHWDAVTASGRLLYRALPDNRLNLFTGISQGFRAPNLSDSTRDGEFGGGIEVPTTDLDPEYYTTYELGAKSQAGWGQAELVLYRTEIRDQIARLSRPTASKRNLDEGYVQGVESRAKLKLSDAWTLNGQVAWQEGEERMYRDNDLRADFTDRPLSRMLPLSGQVGLVWHPLGSRLALEGSVVLASRQDKLSYNDEADNRFPPDGTPGYAVYHLRARYQVNKRLDLSLALENLTDEAYRIHGSGINEPGRQVVVGLHWRF